MDALIMLLAKIFYSDLSQFGIHCPTMGPFHSKALIGKMPGIDVGTVQKIQNGDIKVICSPYNTISTKSLMFHKNKDIEYFTNSRYGWLM